METGRTCSDRLTGLNVLSRLILSPPSLVTHETSLAHMAGDLPGKTSLTASLTDSLLRYPCRGTVGKGLNLTVMSSLQ